jgi:hypothetical protein
MDLLIDIMRAEPAALLAEIFVGGALRRNGQHVAGMSEAKSGIEVSPNTGPSHVLAQDPDVASLIRATLATAAPHKESPEAGHLASGLVNEVGVGAWMLLLEIAASISLTCDLRGEPVM